MNSPISIRTYFPYVWLDTIRDLLATGTPVNPRNQATREILQRSITVDMRYPVLTIPKRKLSYKFMVAEAYWILSGDDRVSTIEPYNKNMAQFSDDGKTFFGAYGPKIVNQFQYVLRALLRDRDTRQAGLTIWRENPKPSKDIPCTVSIFFNIRGDELNCHVFMRSSDAWLGLPYDVFNFSMLTHALCACYNDSQDTMNEKIIRPGLLYLTAASSHLYIRNIDNALKITDSDIRDQEPTPSDLFVKPGHVLKELAILRDTQPGDRRWWEQR